jgi:hypothetical protein
VAILIDASILIEHERGRLDLGQHLVHRQQEEFFLSEALRKLKSNKSIS